MRDLLIVFMLCLGLNNIQSQSQKKPNIIFFFTDDQAYNTLGIYGNKQVKTPNVDELGEQGCVFYNHYNTTAICMASRASVMSGLYEYKTGCNFMHGPMGTQQWSQSFPVLLKNAGYYIGHTGKFGFTISDRKNVDIGGIDGEYAGLFFDYFKKAVIPTPYRTELIPSMSEYVQNYPHTTRAYGAATIDFIQEAVKTGKPFYMSVGFKAPHTPLDPDPFFREVYDGTRWQKPINYGEQGARHLARQSRKGRQVELFEKAYSSDSLFQNSLTRYNQLIYGVDYSIGMVLQKLRELGVEDNTVIIFSSDNGCFSGSHGLGGKVLPYEEGTKAPLIIYDPRRKMRGNRKSKALTAGVDIAATILDLANEAIPDAYDGRSLLPIVDGAKSAVRDMLPLIQVWGPEQIRCLSVLNSAQFKYIYWFYQDKDDNLRPTEELFDLSSDPYEMNNLAEKPEYEERLEEMRELYDEQVKIWSEESLNYNGYKEYAWLFRRDVSWDFKEKLIKEKDSKLSRLKIKH